MEVYSFRRILSQHPTALRELSDDTRLRYEKGKFPKAVQWLLRYPALMRALADDAERQLEQVKAS